MTGFASDLRFAFRALVRSPRLSALAIVMLAFGIGGTTALFSVVDAVLLRALPFREPQRLVEIFGQADERSGMRVPGPIVDALRARSKTVPAIALHGPTGGTLRAADGVVTLFGERVSANFFEVMGVPPFAGRVFVPEDDRPGAPAVMVLSFAFWKQYFRGDPTVIGRTISLDDTPHTIVGIMPPSFRTTFRAARDHWTPHVNKSVREHERTIGYEMIGRLAPGVGLDEARRELRAIAAMAAATTDEDVGGWRAPERTGTTGATGATSVEGAKGAVDSPSGPEGRRRIGLHRFRDEVVRDSAYALQLLLAAVGLVLAIACANVAQLLLARSDRRVGEFAVRQAMGAHAGQLFRLALLESLMLSAAGGLLGVALAYWMVPAILALAPSEIPRLAEATIDGRVLAVAVVLSLLTGCAFGVAPAFRLSRLSVVQAMRPAHGTAGPRRARFLSVLVTSQVAASVTLCALAGLVGRTFLTLLPSAPGFQASARTLFPLALHPDAMPTPADRRQRLADLVGLLEALPGVTGVGVATNVPFGGEVPTRSVRRLDDGGGAGDGAAAHDAEARAVSPNLLRILRMPLLQGRTFTAADGPDAPRVAIVNQQLASRLASDGSGSSRSAGSASSRSASSRRESSRSESPRSESSTLLARRIRVGDAPDAPVYDIIGIVANTRSNGESVEIGNEVYVPYAQSPGSFVYVVVEAPIESAALTAMIRRSVREAIPGQPLRRDLGAMPLDDLMHRALARPRFLAVLMGTLSAASLALAVIGLFGMVAYSVSQRARELGIRAALGARPRHLLGTTLRSAIALTTAGVLLGLMAGAWLTRFVQSQLYAIQPLDPPTFAGAALIMIAAATAAACLPALRVVRADPLAALREE